MFKFVLLHPTFSNDSPEDFRETLFSSDKYEDVEKFGREHLVEKIGICIDTSDCDQWLCGEEVLEDKTFKKLKEYGRLFGINGKILKKKEK